MCASITKIITTILETFYVYNYIEINYILYLTTHSQIPFVIIIINFLLISFNC